MMGVGCNKSAAKRRIPTFAVAITNDASKDLVQWRPTKDLQHFSTVPQVRLSMLRHRAIPNNNVEHGWTMEHRKKKHLLNNSEEHDHMGVEVMDPSRHHGSFNWSIGGDLPRGRAVNMHFRTLVRLWNVHNLGAPGNLDIYEIWSFWYHRDVPNLCIFMWYLMMFEISIYDIYHIYVRWVRYFKLWSKARCRNTLVHTRRQPHSSLRCWKQPKWVGQPRNYENHGEYHIAWRCQK